MERPSCSSTSAHGRGATSPGRRARRACSPPVRPASSAAARIAATSVRGQPAAGALGGLLARDELLVDEAARALRDAPAMPAPARLWRSSSPVSTLAPGSPSASASWLATTSRTSARVRGGPSGASPAAAPRSRAARPASARAARAARARSATRALALEQLRPGAAPRPLRSTARAGGRRRSGSGVSESQLSSRRSAIDSDHIMRLITKSGRRVTAIDTPRSRRARRRALYRSGGRGARAGGDLRAHLAARGPRRRPRRSPAASSTAQVGVESVLVVRGEDGELRAFRNVCRHRAARLREGRGDCGKAMRCPYHGWTYRTDGTLIGVPEGRGFPASTRRSCRSCPPASTCLRPRVRQPRPRRRAARRRASAGWPSGSRPTGSSGSSASPRRRSRQPANWKIVADNYLEGYHVPIAHPGLMRLLDYQRYDGRGRRRLRLVRGAAAREAVGQPARARLPAHGAADAGPRRAPTPASGATSTSTRTRRSTSIPTRSRRGRSTRTGSTRHPRRLRLLPRRAPDRGDARRPAAQPAPQRRRSPTRTPSSSPACRPGWRPAAGSPARSASARRRVAWFADHVRRDAGGRGVTTRRAGRRGRARAHPGGGLRRDRRARDRGRPHRADRHRRRRLARRWCTTTSPRARRCWARRWSTPSSCSATCAPMAADADGWTAAETLGWMIDQSLPFPGMGDREWQLWLELWGRAARRPELRPVAARLYARYEAWIAEVVEDGHRRRRVRRARPARRRAAPRRRDRRYRPAGAGRRSGDAVGARAAADRRAARGRARRSARRLRAARRGVTRRDFLPRRDRRRRAAGGRLRRRPAERAQAGGPAAWRGRRSTATC